MSTTTSSRQPQTTTHTQDAPSRPNFTHPHRVMLGLYLGAFLGMLSETSMNIALPSLMDYFSISAGLAQWMVVGYMLAIGIVLPFVGILLKWVSAKILAQAALTSFLAGAIVSALAPSFPILLAGRMLQGIGTGIILPTLFSAIIHVFPPKRIGAANGVAGLVIMFAPVIGPTAAGILIASYSWRSIFVVFAIVAFIALALTTLFFVNPMTQSKHPLDALSAIASVVGFGSLVCGVSLLSEQGFSPLVIGLIVVGIVVIALYSRRQLRISHPILDVAILGNPNFRTSALIVTLSFTCTLACMYIVPLELQRGLGLDSSTAGILMLPAGIINALFSLIAGRLYDRTGATPLVRTGVVVTLVGIAMFALIGTSTHVAFFVAAHVVIMIGIPLIQQSAQSAALSSLPRNQASDGSTILNTLQQVCGAIGTAIATCLIGLGTAKTADPAQGFVDGSRLGYAFAAVLVILALILSFTNKQTKKIDVAA